jgi:hypothetical protein
LVPNTASKVVVVGEEKKMGLPKKMLEFFDGDFSCSHLGSLDKLIKAKSKGTVLCLVIIY